MKLKMRSALLALLQFTFGCRAPDVIIQVEAADRRCSTMGFIWAGARALRRTHLGRFTKLRPDTAWLEGTLYEMDNPGLPGHFHTFIVFI